MNPSRSVHFHQTDVRPHPAWEVRVSGRPAPVAILRLFPGEREWRLDAFESALGEALHCGWEHPGRARDIKAGEPPAWIRRAAVEQLAAWAFDAIGRIRERAAFAAGLPRRSLP